MLSLSLGSLPLFAATLCDGGQTAAFEEEEVMTVVGVLRTGLMVAAVVAAARKGVAVRLRCHLQEGKAKKHGTRTPPLALPLEALSVQRFCAFLSRPPVSEQVLAV